jgi:flagellar protein FlgJ
MSLIQINDYTGAAAIETGQLAQVKAAADAVETQFSEMLKKAVAEESESDTAKAGRQAKLYEACQALEAVFINQMLQAMRATVPENAFIGDSFATDTFQSMLFEEYAKTMSQTESFGIARALYQQLSAQI